MGRGAPADLGMTMSMIGDLERLECVPDRVGARAAESPGAPAVAAGGRVLTYGELEVRSSRLARRLRSLGVGPDDIVGLCLKSSPAMVVGALGILKAGGAYLALDPSQPQERLASFLNDAKSRLLVTAEDLACRVPRGEWDLIRLDPDGLDRDPEPPEVPPPSLSAKHLAYVIYTSGSTGRPEGVELTHGGLLNLVRWHRRAFAVTAKDRATQIAGVGFDAAVWEMWPYLTAGACLHIPDEAIRQEIGRASC